MVFKSPVKSLYKSPSFVCGDSIWSVDFSGAFNFIDFVDSFGESQVDANKSREMVFPLTISLLFAPNNFCCAVELFASVVDCFVFDARSTV